MTLAILVLAATVVGGEVGPFVSWDDVTADEKHTPGSEEFYDEVDEMTVYDSGIVYRNGTVVTNVPFPAVVASMEDDSDYGWCYDVSQSIGQGEHFQVGYKRRRRIRMNQFDLSWNTWTNISPSIDIPVRYYAYGTGCVKKAISPSVFLPVSRRLDEDTRAALLASYEAYFERLYWGSKGDSNDWDESYYGRKTPGPGFLFNHHAWTNYFDRVYPTNDVRLLEYPNFVNLRKSMQRMFPTYLGGQIEPIWNTRAWIHRPRWITDMGNGYLWWSSSLLPPMEPQPFDDGTHAYEPDPLDFTLLPECAWTNADVSALTRSFAWACHGWTLDVFDRGHGFEKQTDGLNFPCSRLLRELWRDVTEGSTAAPDPVARWETEMTIPDYLTNTFDYAAYESLNQTNAFSKYVSKCWENDSHRLSPSSFAGINQLLSAMDRTIMIPQNPITYTNSVKDCEHEGYYTDTVAPTGRWEGAVFILDYGVGTHTLEKTSETSSKSYKSGSTRTTRYCSLIVFNLDERGLRIDVPLAIGLSSMPIYLDLNFFYYYGYEYDQGLFDGKFVILNTSISSDDSLVCKCAKIVNNIISDVIDIVIPVDRINFGMNQDTFAPLCCRATRRYNVESTDTVSYDDYNAGFVQPPIDAGNRVRESKYALAWERFVGHTNTWWKFDREKPYTRGGWKATMLNHASDATNELHIMSIAHYGADCMKPDRFAPIPETVSVDVDEELVYEKSSYEMESKTNYPIPLSIEKKRFKDTYFIPYYGYDQTNLTTIVSNIDYTARACAYVKTEVAPDGWRWVTEAVTNLVTKPAKYSEYGTSNTESVVALSIAWTNQVERYRWEGEPIGMTFDLEEHTNYFNDVEKTIVESMEYYGEQTNVFVYYDKYMSVTNVTTNLTGIAYYSESTNSIHELEYDDTIFRRWQEHLMPVGEMWEYVWLDTYEYLYFENGMIYIAYFDPVTYELVIKYPAELPYNVGVASATVNLRGSGMPYNASAEWPKMPVHGFNVKEGFRPITRVDWNWKSMHDKGN